MPGWARYLLPGQIDTVKVEFNTHGKNGQQTKTVNVTTSDPSNKDLTFTISGSIFEPIKVSPPALAFHVAPNGSDSKAIQITNNMDKPLTLKEPIFPDDESKTYFKVKMDKKVLKKGEVCTVTFDFKAGAEAKLFKTFTVNTDDMENPALALRINAFVDNNSTPAATTIQSPTK